MTKRNLIKIKVVYFCALILLNVSSVIPKYEAIYVNGIYFILNG
jgi:hypothetical protein